ncbi:MAG: hypothetical protein ACI9TV_003199 [Sulfurimonas sp.]|jgi:hypothetical protein|uniref:hypothetical protein n=1 Tax=Sulfurimonas sp. TaxID=2022749 RepID=UPI0039E2C1E9
MMKIIVIFTLFTFSLLVASSTNKSENEAKQRAAKQLKIEMEKEKKYSRERTFYKSSNYDFKGAQVNPDSLDSVPNLEPDDDFDMDSVYD